MVNCADLTRWPYWASLNPYFLERFIAMKVWIALAESNNGNEIAYFFSESDADRYAHNFCKDRWHVDNGPMPEKWKVAYEFLSRNPSYADWLHMDVLDITGHPALTEARLELKSIIESGQNGSLITCAKIFSHLGGEISQ